MVSPVLIVFMFALLGFGLKYIDDAFDEGLYNKELAMLMAPILVAIWVWLSIHDYFSATILFSILFAVILSGKVDNRIFRLSGIVLILILLATELICILWGPLFVLTLMGIIDEKGNDYVEVYKVSEILEFFFKHRCGMKVGILGLWLTSIAPAFYMIALLAFDIAYESVKFLHTTLSSKK